MSSKQIYFNVKKILNTRVGKILKIIILIIIIVALVLLALVKIFNNYPPRENLNYQPRFFGVTFSTEYAADLGLDWKTVYQAILSDLQVKQIRIPVYWDEIEPTLGTYDFSKYDYMLAEGSKYNVKFIISIGRRVPRWPECHAPAWVNQERTSQAESQTLQMIKTVVEHYRGNSNIAYWQVENEPFLGTFGQCPPLDKNFLKQEFALVRSLDNRPIIITGSGEMSTWRQEAKIGDIFGTTLYRVVYNPWLGYIHYPFPTTFYRFKARLAGLSANRLMVLELQAEPWVPSGNITQLNQLQIDKSMSLAQFRANLQYAINLNFQKAYLWGVEWWYYEKQNGHPQYWDLAKTLFK